MVAAVQLPLTPPLPTPVPLDPKLFRPGTLLEALVVGKTPDGFAQLQIGDLLVAARLPQVPPVGTTLQLTVKSGGPAPELVVLASSPQAPAPPPAPAAAAAPLPPVASPAPTSAPMPLVASPLLTTSLPSVSSEAPAVASAPIGIALSQPSVLASALPSAGQGLEVDSAGPLPVIAETSAPRATPSIQGAAPSPLVVVPELPPTASLASPAVALAPGGSAPDVPGPVSPVSSGPSFSNSAPSAGLASRANIPAVSLEAPLAAPSPPISAPSPFRSAVLSPTNAAQPPLPQTPQAALAQMVPAALSQQGSPAPLLQAISAIVASATPIPPPVLRAAQQLLATRLPAAAINGDTLKSAVERSGVMLEALLATGAPPQTGDAKVGLLALRAALVSWLGDLPPIDPVRRVPPPIKGETLRAQFTEPLPDLPVDAREAGRTLHAHTDAALSRLKLMQFASIPDGDGARQAPPHLRLELPLMVGAELAMAQLQISRDGKREKETAKRGWTVRFAVATAATGEVGAEVGLMGRTVNVALWAVEDETARAIAGTLPDLAGSLDRLGLMSTVRMRSGPPRRNPAPAGQFVDRGS